MTFQCIYFFLKAWIYLISQLLIARQLNEKDNLLSQDLDWGNFHS